jgi:L-asparagine transporter-like permease
LVVALLSFAGIVLTTFSSSSSNVFNNLVDNIGVLVAFYYGFTGIACAWAFRKTLGQNFRSNVTMVYLPLIGGLSLLFVCYQVMISGGATALPDMIVLASGIPFLLFTMFKTRNKTNFFKQPRVAYDTID